MVEDVEALDLLRLGVARVRLVDHALDERDHLRLARERRDVLGQPALAREVDDLLGIERQERHGVRAPVAVHHGLRDPARGLEVFSRLAGVRFLPPEVMMMSFLRPVM